MAEFVIKLADERGRVMEQVQTASTAEELRARFSHAGYHVFSVRARSGLGGMSRRKVKLEPFLIFNQQFLTLIRAGLPILGSLQMLTKIQKSAHFRSQLDDVSNRVKTGEALSTAFEAQTGVPDHVHHHPARRRTLRQSAGGSRTLHRIPTRLAHLSQEAHRLAHLSRLCCSRLSAACSSSCSPWSSRSSPSFTTRWAPSCPRLTVGLLTFGKWTQHNILWIALTVLVIAVVLWRFSITEKGRDMVDGIRVRMPIFGKIWLKYQVALFSRTLSTLLTGGLPLVPSLETAARSISSRRVSKAVGSAIGTVREGKNLADSLSNTGVFPDLATEMISVGEQTGALPQMLNSVAEFFEEDVATALTAALSLIEPAILIVMGVVVVFILISLYLPIFSLGSAAGGGQG